MDFEILLFQHYRLLTVFLNSLFLLKNIEFTGGTIIALLSYIPWTILQGGLEECGWRWYLQPKLKISSFVRKMIVISIIWFLWHIPIYIDCLGLQ